MTSLLEAEDELKAALCNIKATINDKKVNVQTNENLSIDYDNVEWELDTLPSIYHLWAMLYSEVKEQVNISEKRIRRRRGHLTNEILSNDGKSLRRGDIADILECDDVLMKEEAEHIRLQKIAGKLYFTLEALKMKNDNLRSLSGFKKNEAKGG